MNRVFSTFQTAFFLNRDKNKHGKNSKRLISHKMPIEIITTFEQLKSAPKNRAK